MDFQSEKSFGKLRLRAFQPYHQTLCILKHVEDVKDNLWHASTYIYLSFPKLFSDWKSSIKEVMSQNVCVCSFPIFDIFDIHSITALRCIWSIFDIFDIHSITAVRCTLSIFNIFNIALIFCTVFNAFNAMYLNTSNIKQCALTHIDMHPLMYTQQIRWQWVTMVWMSGFLTI